MYVANLAHLLRKFRGETSPALSAVSDYSIFRNDWKISDQFKRLSAVPGVLPALLSDFADSNKPIVVDIDPLGLEPSRSDPVPGFMLDADLYADHIYVGSTRGLFESRFDPGQPLVSSPVVLRLDHEVSTVNAKYSVINTSAGEKGLLYAHVNFDQGNWWSGKPTFKRAAEVSYGNSFASHHHLLNYVNDLFPTFLRAETQRKERDQGSEYQESRVIGYQDQVDISGMTRAAIGRSRKVRLSESEALRTQSEDAPTAQVLGNSADRLLIRWFDNLQVVDISAPRNKDLAARPDPNYRTLREADILPSSILKTYAIKSGFLVELFDEIHLITPKGSYLLVRERAARVRTFIHARRYQDVALIVGEESLSLIGFIES